MVSPLLMLSMSLQQMVEQPQLPFMPKLSIMQAVKLFSGTNADGDMWGTQGNENNASFVGLVYANNVSQYTREAFLQNFLDGHRIGRDIEINIANQALFVPMGKGSDIITGQDCGLIAWLYVPLYNDFVLVNLYWGNKPDPDEIDQIKGYIKRDQGKTKSAKCLRAPGIISYVDGALNPIKQRGYFYWYSMWEAHDFSPLMVGGKGHGDLLPNPLRDMSRLDENNRHPNDAAVRKWIYYDVIDRNQAFEYVMCMPEIGQGPNFRNKLHIVAVDQNTVSRVRKSFKGVIYDGLPEQSKRLFPQGFEDDFQAYSVRQLRERFAKHNNNDHQGQLFIMQKSEFIKNKQSYQVDIRWLQSNFLGAVFQIASTLTCLEGGVKSYNNPLDAMNHTPVQGENAVLGTIAAAIVRRYFVEQQDRNLLFHTAGIFQGVENNYDPHIEAIRGKFSYEALLQKSQKSADISDDDKAIALYDAIAGDMRVAVHHNIMVNGGSWGVYDIEIPRSNAPFKNALDPVTMRRVPAFDRWLNKPLQVHHIYTSALNINPRSLAKHGGVPPILQEQDFIIPKIVLRGMYEGTLLAAGELLSKQKYKHPTVASLPAFLNTALDTPRLFLTMVGAGAFYNRPEWIVEILGQLRALIKKLNLQICIVVWDTDPNAIWIQQLEAIARVINTSSLDTLSQQAEKSGEQIWLFDDKGHWTPRFSKDALVTLPIEEYNQQTKVSIKGKYIELKVV